MWKRFLRSHVNAMPSASSRQAALNALSRYTRGISWESSVDGCKDIAKQAKGIRESGATPPPPRSHPRGGFLHYDGMHNAGWVRRRAVCASYIAMADGRDSEKDFPNRISSPRTAYIFHDRGRANRLPLLSSIFCAPRGITAGYGGSMRTNRNVSRGLSHGSRKLAGKSERKTYSKARDI